MVIFQSELLVYQRVIEVKSGCRKYHSYCHWCQPRWLSFVCLKLEFEEQTWSRNHWKSGCFATEMTFNQISAVERLQWGLLDSFQIPTFLCQLKISWTFMTYDQHHIVYETIEHHAIYWLSGSLKYCLPSSWIIGFTVRDVFGSNEFSFAVRSCYYSVELQNIGMTIRAAGLCGGHFFFDVARPWIKYCMYVVQPGGYTKIIRKSKRRLVDR